MIRIIRTRTLAEAAAETARYRLAWQETERTLALYRDSLRDALNELHSLRNAHQAVSDQARDWETQYRAVVDGIGAWIGEVRSAVADPATGSEFQGTLAVALWRSFVERAEEAGEADNTAVRLIKLLVVQDPEASPAPAGGPESGVQTSPAAEPERGQERHSRAVDWSLCDCRTRDGYHEVDCASLRDATIRAVVRELGPAATVKTIGDELVRRGGPFFDEEDIMRILRNPLPADVSRPDVQTSQSAVDGCGGAA